MDKCWLSGVDGLSFVKHYTMSSDYQGNFYRFILNIFAADFDVYCYILLTNATYIKHHIFLFLLSLLFVQDVNEIFSNLCSASWAERKEGLLQFNALLQNGRFLNR